MLYDNISPPKFSNEGSLLIQGKDIILSADLRYFYNNSGKLPAIKPKSSDVGTDSCTVRIFWNAPFTLKGVPILRYNVYITNNESGNKKEKFVKSTKFLIQFGQFNSINISIAAVNGAGEGNLSVPLKIDMNDYVKGFSISNVEMSRHYNQWNVQALLKVRYKISNFVNQIILIL